MTRSFISGINKVSKLKKLSLCELGRVLNSSNFLALHFIQNKKPAKINSKNDFCGCETSTHKIPAFLLNINKCYTEALFFLRIYSVTICRSRLTEVYATHTCGCAI